MAKKRTELTPQEVAERCGVTAQTVKLWCRKGRFPNARREAAGRAVNWLIPEADLKGWAERGGRGNSSGQPARGMTPKELKSRKEAKRKRAKEKAMARWEGEGGATLPPPRAGVEREG